MRIFIQGDRDPEHRAANAVAELGKLLKERGAIVNCGAYGGFVWALERSGVQCRIHTMDPDRDNEPMNRGVNSSIVDGVKIAEALQRFLELIITEHKIGTAICLKDLAWGLRLGILMATSDAFVFFAGRQGTVAHLVPVLARMMKVQDPKRVVLIGWESSTVERICSIIGMSGKEPWFRSFRNDEGLFTVSFLYGTTIEHAGTCAI